MVLWDVKTTLSPAPTLLTCLSPSPSGKTPVSCFLTKSQQSSQKELSNLKSVEDSLDEVIKTCAKQLFDLTDNPDNIKYPFHAQVKGHTVIVMVIPQIHFCIRGKNQLAFYRFLGYLNGIYIFIWPSTDGPWTVLYIATLSYWLSLWTSTTPSRQLAASGSWPAQETLVLG